MVGAVPLATRVNTWRKPFHYADIVIITVAAASLFVGALLPWYRLTASACGESHSLAVSLVSAGGWWLAMPIVVFLTWLASLSQGFRLAVMIGAWASFLMTLIWGFLSSPVLELHWLCPKESPFNFSNLPAGPGLGVGVYLCVVAGLAMVYGAHLRSRRLVISHKSSL